MSQIPEPPVIHYARRGPRPHRGTLVLVLGILGLAVCVICGIIAWVMGSSDLRAMDDGTMDPRGRDLTKAGRICGMISVILTLVGCGLYLVFILIMVVSSQF